MRSLHSMIDDRNHKVFNSIDDVELGFSEHRYITDWMLATSIYLATELGKPFYLEGDLDHRRSVVIVHSDRWDRGDAGVCKLRCH